MKRLEQAVRIRDIVLAAPPAAWSWEQVSQHRARRVTGEGWHALVATPFNPLHQEITVDTYEQALILGRGSRPLPYQLDLWVTGEGKVLSLEWNDEASRLISMRPGAWKQKLFDLPL